jgi:hypothetical protein
MIIKSHYGQHGQQQPSYFSLIALIAAAMFSITSIITFPNIPQIEAISTSSTCVDDQPCQTMVCAEDQPCKIIKSPNTDFDADENTVQQPLEGTGIIGRVPPPYPYSNDYWKDQQEYLEERQDMMEDAEYE